MQKFSIILPVRNGGNYLKACINSILSQTFVDFNLIVLDNASTDGSLEWVQSINDARIMIYPSSESLSIEKNWARIVEVPKNEFMTCIGHDDIFLPGYLEEMNRLILQYPDASLYQTHFSYINADGEIIRSCLPSAELQYPKDFLGHILSNSIDVNGTGFMTRSRDFERIGGIPAYPNLLFADFVLWMELTRINYLATSPKNCFSYRLHQSMTTTSTDEKFQSAFELFVNYLYSLKQADPKLNDVIQNDAGTILVFYCKSFSHRLLRTKIKLRENLTVKVWANKCDQFANLLIENNKLNPSSSFSVQLAQAIDSTALTRTLFLTFKKIYSKPIL